MKGILDYKDSQPSSRPLEIPGIVSERLMGETTTPYQSIRLMLSTIVRLVVVCTYCILRVEDVGGR